jgi:hypothetical protein
LHNQEEKQMKLNKIINSLRLFFPCLLPNR